MPSATLPLSPPKSELAFRAVFKWLAPAHRCLAGLKGLAWAILNEYILIHTLALREAKDSSEIENIVTTQYDLYKADLFADCIRDPAAKIDADPHGDPGPARGVRRAGNGERLT